jgi:AraC family transcriptional regulator, transcriptional activator of pobA
MQKSTDAIRVAKLASPFMYRTMQDIEAARKPNAPAELPHRHDFYTIIAVENSPGGLHDIDFKHYELTSNTLYFIAPEQVHHLEVNKGDIKGHAVMFTAEFLLRYSLSSQQLTTLGLFFNCDESKPLILGTTEMQSLYLFFEHFAKAPQHLNPEQSEITGAWLKLFLFECKQLKAQHMVAAPPLEHRQSAIVRRFKQDVEEHFAQWHQVSHYAAAQHLTGNYLNEIVKSETGTSAKDMIQNRLILEAKRLALYSNMSAKEIAFRLGYEDVAHFSKFFKKCSGITFSDFKSAASNV